MYLTPRCRSKSQAAYRKEQMLSLLDDLDADVEATKPIDWTVKNLMKPPAGFVASGHIASDCPCYANRTLLHLPFLMGVQNTTSKRQVGALSEVSVCDECVGTPSGFRPTLSV